MKTFLVNLLKIIIKLHPAHDWTAASIQPLCFHSKVCGIVSSSSLYLDERSPPFHHLLPHPDFLGIKNLDENGGNVFSTTF